MHDVSTGSWSLPHAGAPFEHATVRTPIACVRATMKRSLIAVPLAFVAAVACGNSPNPSDTENLDASGPTVDAATPGVGTTSPGDAQSADRLAPLEGGGSPPPADAQSDAPNEAGMSGLAADAGSWSCDAYGTDLCFCRSGSADGSAAGCGGSWSCCFLASSSSHYSCECTNDDQTTCTSTIAMLPNGVQVATCPPP